MYYVSDLCIAVGDQLIKYKELHSRSAEIGGQGQAVWGWKSVAESRDKVFGGLPGGQPPKMGAWGTAPILAVLFYAVCQAVSTPILCIWVSIMFMMRQIVQKLG